MSCLSTLPCVAVFIVSATLYVIAMHMSMTLQVVTPCRLPPLPTCQAPVGLPPAHARDDSWAARNEGGGIPRPVFFY